MPFLQLRDSRYPLRPGENRVGWGADLEVRLPAAEGTGDAIAALVANERAGVTLSPADAPQTVSLNGVTVAEPTPLLHGDRVMIGNLELRFGDEAQLGETVDLPAGDDNRIAVPGPAARTSRIDGRLLSQVDGREYPVPDSGLTLGRDPSCDVVIASPEVSRQHASIRKTDEGYLVLDTSANGIWVNDARVQAELPLGRGDSIRVGREEFRFHAADAPSPHSQVPIPGLANTGTFTVAQRPSAPAAGKTEPRPVLGCLEIMNEGPTKGTRFDITLPRVEIGRGQYNDIVLPDESVSESHAKLQRRDDAWWLVDVASTNGTYLAGSRITDEVQLISGHEVRFGGVKAVFRLTGYAARPSGETRVIVGVKGPDPKRAEARLKELAEHASPAEVKGGRRSTMVWLVLLVLVALILSAIWRVGGQ